MEILYCGVCHSDLHWARNDWGWSAYPVVPGHEIVGRVIEVGPEVTRFNAGDHVAVGCMVDSCQRCDQCRKGEEQLCREGNTGTYRGLDRLTREMTQGGYSKHVVVREEFVLHASTEQEFDTVFSALPQLRAGGVVFTSDPYFANRSQQLAALAVRHAMPAITQSRDFAIAGGLMSYGGDFTQSHRRAGIYVGRILNGEKPSDLPVQLVTKVELFVNLNAANKLGVTVPPSLISGADVVIE